MFLRLFSKRIPFVPFLFHSKMAASRKYKMATMFFKEIFITQNDTNIIMVSLGIFAWPNKSNKHTSKTILIFFMKMAVIFQDGRQNSCKMLFWSYCWFYLS
jgi:hypothetical protein